MLPDKPFSTAAELPADFAVDRLETRGPDRAVLMVTPDHFTIAYAINPHMRDQEGRLNVVDSARAQSQWAALKDAYQQLGFAVETISGAPDLPDMVFAANQSFPFLDRNGRKSVVISNMAAPERRPETDLFAAWYKSRDWTVAKLDADLGAIEGMGDALWVPRRRLLFVGHGFRTSRRAAEKMAERVATPVFLLELVDERFYHLDTALAPLNERTCLVFRPAFTPSGLALIERIFEEVIAVDEKDAIDGFACNAHCPDGRHVLLEPPAVRTGERLRASGFLPTFVDVSEFRKSGGSVFCMKMMLPAF